MNTSAIEYLLNPIVFILYLIFKVDFMTENKRNYAYFFLNLIIGLIISIFSMAYNEFIILYFCDLDKNTHLQIAMRSEIKESINLQDIIDDENNDEDV